ncbi:hypothetical protein J6590_048528 [Homalodisca vitripennis]|nr:hypothetical protein J6590_048528 [Homalodisca vitripennis]
MMTSLVQNEKQPYAEDHGGAYVLTITTGVTQKTPPPIKLPSSQHLKELSLQEAMWTTEQTDRERQRDETEVTTTTPRRWHGGTPTAVDWIGMPVSRE